MATLTIAHKQWASRPADERFTSLATLREAVNARRALSQTRKRKINDIEVTVDEADNLILNHTIRATTPSHWSFGQICGAVKAPAGFLRTLPPQIVATSLNHCLRKAPDMDFNLMTVTDPDGGPNTLQAVTSATYGRIWDADVVDAVGRLVDRSGGRFYNPPAYAAGKFGGAPEPSGLYASDHDVFMFMVDGGSRLEAGPRAQLNRGFIVWNSETGAKTLGIMAFMFNEVCGNHFIFGAQRVQTMLIKHTSGAPARFDREVMPVLLDYMQASPKPVEDAVRRSQALMLDKVLSVPGEKVLEEAWVAAFAKQWKFTKGEVKDATACANREEGRCASVWDLVQGLTASAREYEHIDARLNLEKRAGDLFSDVCGSALA